MKFSIEIEIDERPGVETVKVFMGPRIFAEHGLRSLPNWLYEIVNHKLIAEHKRLDTLRDLCERSEEAKEGLATCGVKDEKDVSILQCPSCRHISHRSDSGITICGNPSCNYTEPLEGNISNPSLLCKECGQSLYQQSEAVATCETFSCKMCGEPRCIECGAEHKNGCCQNAKCNAQPVIPIPPVTYNYRMIHYLSEKAEDGIVCDCCGEKLNILPEMVGDLYEGVCNNPDCDFYRNSTRIAPVHFEPYRNAHI